LIDHNEGRSVLGVVPPGVAVPRTTAVRSLIAASWRRMPHRDRRLTDRPNKVVTMSDDCEMPVMAYHASHQKSTWYARRSNELARRHNRRPCGHLTVVKTRGWGAAEITNIDQQTHRFPAFGMIHVHATCWQQAAYNIVATDASWLGRVTSSSLAAQLARRVRCRCAPAIGTRATPSAS
jgi:hypothetical protein